MAGIGTRALLPAVGAAFLSSVATACPNCATSREVWSEIAGRSPGNTLGLLTFAFCVVIALIVFSARMMHLFRWVFGGALLLGAGLGASIDGIVLHQILQWHGMLTGVIVPVDLVSSKVNMFWDGVFHLYSWLAIVVGAAIVANHIPRADAHVRTRVLVGGAIAGWGFFNLVEGLIDHQIVQLHHVHPGADELAWDLGFLALGALLVAGGAAVAVPVLRSDVRDRQQRPSRI